MPAEQSHSSDTVNRALSDLAQLRHFTGAPSEFWNTYLSAAAGIAGASQAVLVLKKAQQPDAWQKLSQWPAGGQADRYGLVFTKQLRDIAETCSQQGSLLQSLDGAVPSSAKPYALAIRLRLARTEDICIAIFLVLNAVETQAREVLLRLQLVADTPASFQLFNQVQQAKADVEKFAAVLDLMAQVNAEKRFVAAALAFCNGLAGGHRCDRVSLGWHESGFVRLQAISRTERFDKNMVAVKTLEIAMEEALDQDEEIVWPSPPGTSLVTRDHESLAREQGAQFICSLTLRLEGKPVAVVTCERHTEAFAESELKQLRLSCDQAVRRLSDLKRWDRWIGKRFITSVREGISRFVGVEHTWKKALVIIASLAVMLVLVLRLNYRVEAKFILHSDELTYLTAPFDGYIAGVPVRAGEPVKKMQTLLSLNRDELELEEAAAVADLSRYSREAEKARAANALADMRIAQALADQARARLELVRYRLEQSQLRAPFDGVVAEGDQKERIGAPVKQGEVLFKVARTDTLYVEAEVNERDIHEIRPDSRGEIAFASQPKLKFPIRLIRIQPAAQPKQGENIFLARCEFPGRPEAWWRPGMTGITKLEAGRRSLLWILTHRTVDYLRMLLWW
jgi:hypothetical protein